MEHSGRREGDVQKDTALWGGAPQYDYVQFEHCTSYGIPLEAGHETGGTGDNTCYQEKAFNHTQVGWPTGVGNQLVGLNRLLGFCCCFAKAGRN